MRRTFVCFVIATTLLFPLAAWTSSLEPRLYSNIPTDLNFVGVGYAYTHGALADNPQLGLTDPDLSVHGIGFGYARGIDIGGHSGKVDLAVPLACIDGKAQQEDVQVQRHVCGVGDVKARIGINLFGAPAMPLKRFASYEQETIFGMSFQVTAPTGQYESDRLVNIGTNRWAFKPGMGLSQALGDWLVELSGDVEFYTDNGSFYGGITRKQEPVYSTQAHVIYTFENRIWIGYDINYFWGGQYISNGVGSGEELKNSRSGLTLSMPLTRAFSFKLYGSSGVSTRTGTDFDMLGIVFQVRWKD